jgi:hypothetical protein
VNIAILKPSGPGSKRKIKLKSNKVSCSINSDIFVTGDDNPLLITQSEIENSQQDNLIVSTAILRSVLLY